jgi:hypothetical protein
MCELVDNVVNFLYFFMMLVGDVPYAFLALDLYTMNPDCQLDILQFY